MKIHNFVSNMLYLSKVSKHKLIVQPIVISIKYEILLKDRNENQTPNHIKTKFE